MGALFAAALLSQGETRISAMAGAPYSSFRVERGFGTLTAEAGADLTGFVRPVAGLRLRIVESGAFGLSTHLEAGRVFPLFPTPVATARTWDAKASVRADWSFSRAVLLVQAAVVGQSDFKAEHSLAFAEFLGGTDLAVRGPLWLLARAGVRRGSFESKAIGWAGAAVRW